MCVVTDLRLLLQLHVGGRVEDRAAGPRSQGRPFCARSRASCSHGEGRRRVDQDQMWDQQRAGHVWGRRSEDASLLPIWRHCALNLPPCPPSLHCNLTDALVLITGKHSFAHGEHGTGGQDTDDCSDSTACQGTRRRTSAEGAQPGGRDHPERQDTHADVLAFYRRRHDTSTDEDHTVVETQQRRRSPGDGAT